MPCYQFAITAEINTTILELKKWYWFIFSVLCSEIWVGSASFSAVGFTKTRSNCCWLVSYQEAVGSLWEAPWLLVESSSLQLWDWCACPSFPTGCQLGLLLAWRGPSLVLVHRSLLGRASNSKSNLLLFESKGESASAQSCPTLL